MYVFLQYLHSYFTGFSAPFPDVVAIVFFSRSKKQFIKGCSSQVHSPAILDEPAKMLSLGLRSMRNGHKRSQDGGIGGRFDFNQDCPFAG